MTIPENIQEKIEAKAIDICPSCNDRGSYQSCVCNKLETMAEFGYHLRDQELEAKDKEIADLKAWKELMISVTPDMQAIGRALKIPLGESIHDKILTGIQRLKGLIGEAWRQSLTNCEVENGEGEEWEGYISWVDFKKLHNL